MKRNSPLWIPLVALLWPALVLAQTEIDVPRNYALTNARVVIAPGRVLERATIVLRDGRIEAVGERVQVPEGVITMDLSGLTVYPGLIDAASNLGLPPIQTDGGRRGGAGGGAAADDDGEGPPPELSPARNASDVWLPSGSDLEALRGAGITLLGLAFDGGIFPGRVSAVSLRDGSPEQRVVKAPVAQQIAFGRRRGGYPTTLMGSLAYIKQSFADARWDARVAAAFEKSPSTAPRPRYDPEHRALQPAAAGSMPVWFQASTANDLKRVVRLAKELNVTDYVIVGAQEGYQVANELKATGRPVIVSLDFPDPNTLTGRAYELHVAPVSGPDREGERLDSVAARTARGNAAALVRAGVPVALSSFGLAGPAEIRGALLAAIEAGLSPDDALRALTVTPAQILGLGSAAGTVEVGKLANLVVVQGDLFTRDARIRHVFVEGEKYDIRDAPARGQGTGARRGGGPGGEGAEGAAVATGQWSGTVDAEGMQHAVTINITGSPDALSGTISSDMGTMPVSGQLSGADLTLRGVMTTPDGEFPLVLNARITGDRFEGTVAVGDMGRFPITARRRPGGAANSSFNGGLR